MWQVWLTTYSSSHFSLFFFLNTSKNRLGWFLWALLGPTQENSLETTDVRQPAPPLPPTHTGDMVYCQSGGQKLTANFLKSILPSLPMWDVVFSLKDIESLGALDRIRSGKAGMSVRVLPDQSLLLPAGFLQGSNPTWESKYHFY